MVLGGWTVCGDGLCGGVFDSGGCGLSALLIEEGAEERDAVAVGVIAAAVGEGAGLVAGALPGGLAFGSASLDVGEGGGGKAVVDRLAVDYLRRDAVPPEAGGGGVAVVEGVEDDEGGVERRRELDGAGGVDGLGGGDLGGGLGDAALLFEDMRRDEVGV